MEYRSLPPIPHTMFRLTLGVSLPRSAKENQRHQRMQNVSQVRVELGRIGKFMGCNDCLREASPSASMLHTLEQMLKVYRLRATSKDTRRQAHVYFANGKPMRSRNTCIS